VAGHSEQSPRGRARIRGLLRVRSALARWRRQEDDELASHS
jgi:hypothetical protein